MRGRGERTGRGTGSVSGEGESGRAEGVRE